MSKTGDMTAEERPRRGDGSLTRYAFTLAVTTAIALALIAFMYLLEQRTGDTASRLDIPQRSTTQIYTDADLLEAPALRMRALRNFVNAYPKAPEAARARIDIAELERTETQDFSVLTETFYDLRAAREKKILALDTFTAQWGKSRFSDEITAMETQLDIDNQQQDIEPQPKAQITLEGGRAAPDPAIEEFAGRETDTLAGGIVEPVKIVKPVMPAPPPRIVPKIIEASIKKGATPRYPRRAQSRGVEAVVTVAMDIDAQGKVQDARVIKPPTGRYARDFNRAAISAAKRTVFNPRMVDDKASPTNGYVRTYRFELED